MNHLTFIWDQSQNQRHQRKHWQELLYWIGLFFAALLLFTFNLDAPLLRGDESIIAQVAKEMSQSSFSLGRWFEPTLWGEPFAQYPPLAISLTAIAYLWGGVDEQMTRLPGAILAAFSVPLFYGLGREIFARRISALFCALIFLTLFPVVLQGRLAMLDGALLCFEILTIFCLLRSRRDLRWSLGVGLSLSCLLLTHSVIGLVLGLIVLSFVAWDTPRLLTSGYFWLGIGLGLLPAISWYGEQYTNYGYPRLYSLFIQPFKEDQGIFGRLLGIQGLELVKSSLPWLIFTLYGCYLARKNLVWGWAKLILVWGGVYLIIFTLLPLPNIGYLTPLYPPLALAGGIALADVYHSPVDRPYPKLWGMILFGLSVGISLVGFSFWLNFPLDLSHLSHRFLLILTLGAIALTFLTTAILITQRDPQFIIILFWGMYVSLLLLVNSPYWNGIMVSNQYVQPLAAMLSDRVPVDQVIYADFSEEDPVLNFYSDRQVIPATPEKLLRYWHILEQPYLLINLDTWQKLPLESVHPLDQSPPNWYLITRLKSQDNSEKKIEQL